MNLNWSNRVIKYVLFVFNFLFVISGIIMIAVGVSIKSYYTDYDFFLNSSYFSLPNLLIATGSLIFFISFFGCCGAIKESWFMIFIFAILLSIIFILEFSAGIAGYVLRDKTASYLEETLLESMKDYKFNENADDTTKMWDLIQYEFQCCGAKGPFDWRTPSEPITSVSTVPSNATQTAVTSPTPVPETTTPVINSSTETMTSLNSSLPTAPTGQSETTTPTTVHENPITTAALQTNSKKNPDDLPVSCCKPNPGATGTTNCTLSNNSTMTYFKTGCVEGFGDYLKDHAVTIGGVGIAIAFIQLFAVIFACHLAKQLKHGFYST